MHAQAGSEKYIDDEVKIAAQFGIGAASSVGNILERSFDGIRNKYMDLKRELSDDDMCLLLYREVRARNHFAKAFVESYFSGVITMCPLVDKKLQQLKTFSYGCIDHNLLISVIFDRYNPKLLDFKFDSGRRIEESTIEYARILNEKYPCTVWRKPADASGKGSAAVNTENKGEAPSDQECAETAEPYAVSDLKSQDPSEGKNPAIEPAEALGEKDKESPKIQMREFIKDSFYSPACRNVFTSLYSQRIYYRFAERLETRPYYPESSAYIVMAIAVYHDICDESTGLSLKEYNNIYERVNAWARKTSLSNRLSHNMMYDPYILNYITARIDVRGIGDSGAVIRLKETSDKDAVITSPEWINKNGSGYMIQAQNGRISLSFECIRGGTLGIYLRSADVRDVNNNRVRFYIDYSSLVVDDEVVFDETKCQYHDRSYRFEKEMSEGDEISLSVTWSYHDGRIENTDLELRECIADAQTKLKAACAEKSEINAKLKQTCAEKSETDAKLKQAYAEKSEINKKLKKTCTEKTEINAKLQRTYAEKSEINAKLQLTYKEKAEREIRIKQLGSENEELKKDLDKLEKELETLKASRSYRLGRALTAPVRKIKKAAGH